MIVMKFGGTSLGSGETIEHVCEIVQERRDLHPLVIVSAHGKALGHETKITDLLIQAASDALAGRPDVSAIAERQRGVLAELGLELPEVEALLDNLSDLLKGICMVEELTTRTLDLVQSFGERMSARVLAAALTKSGVSATAMDAWELGLRTDNRYGSAQPEIESYPGIAKTWRGIDSDVVVTTGFIAKCGDGHVTTLGRGGSDYSATIFGSALGADEVQIWTDVNGVMSADPGIVDNARSLPELSFDEAAELAWYGAQVLHPSTILPAVDANIPVRVLNTMEPSNPGTVILPSLTDKGVAKSVVYKEDLWLINIVSSRMLMNCGFMAKVFEIFGRHEIVINMIATSEVTISLTTDAPTERLAPVLEELRTYGTVDAKDRHAIICLVGEGMGGHRGTAARVFQSLADAEINVQMISQGAREINIAVLINNDDIEAAVTALHSEFFGEKA